jgi:large subunit ribosomal protein L21
VKQGGRRENAGNFDQNPGKSSAGTRVILTFSAPSANYFVPTFEGTNRTMYAIIEDSGVQYKVQSGDKILIDRKLEDHPKLVEAVKIKFDRVLLVGGDGASKIGAPVVAGASVEGEVIRSMRDKKVIVEKHTRRKRYHRKYGHRQNYIEVSITGIKA